MPEKIDISKYKLTKADKSRCSNRHAGYFLHSDDGDGPMFFLCPKCGEIRDSKKGTIRKGTNE